MRRIMQELLDAGINDWSGISPLTPDYINPEKPWPHLEPATPAHRERKDFCSVSDLPVYPEFLPNLSCRDQDCWQKLAAARDREGLAREARGPHDLSCSPGAQEAPSLLTVCSKSSIPADSPWSSTHGDDLLWWGLYIVARY